MKFRPLSYALGAEVTGLDLAQEISAAAFVRKDHARWKQIIAKNQIRGE